MKKTTLFLAVVLTVSLLAGCVGTPVVYYSDCTCPAGSHDTNVVPVVTEPAYVPVEGEVKTGLYLTTATTGSSGATDDSQGQCSYEITMVAVTVDEAGVIQSCIIDGINTTMAFDNQGNLVGDITTGPQTKNELGDNYGMVAWGGAIAEWREQAQALANYALGKTVEELKNGAVDESGYAPQGTDLASSATIYLGGYVAAIAQAVEQAQYLGAKGNDQLHLACQTGWQDSVSATDDTQGTAQLDVTVTALTMDGQTITSCVLDAVQAKVGFDGAGQLVGDLEDHVATKNELGDNYGMVAWGGAIAEWNAQAAGFAAYVTGKTLEQVQGIAVDESTRPVEADLASSVTIAIGGFQSLIAKAVMG